MMTTIFNPIGFLAPLPAAHALEMLGELAQARLLPPAPAEPTTLATAPFAEAAVAGAGRFAPSALEKLRARFDPDKKYSDEEKLEMAKLLPDVVEEMRFKIVLLSENKGYQISHIKRELAGIFIFSLIREASVSWQGHQLVVVRPLTPSPFTVGAAVHSSLKSAAWPLDFDDLGVRVRLQLLGWRITQEVAGDTVTLRIDFGASLYPKPDLMEEWYQNLLEDLRKSVDTQLSDTGNRKRNLLSALGKVYKNRITAVSDSSPDPSDWDYFLEDIQTLRDALAKMEELQTSLQSGVAAGAFTMEEFWEALRHGDGRTSYENWMARVERAKGAHEEGVQTARRELWGRFESLQRHMEVIKRELMRKIQSGEEALSIANWMVAQVQQTKPMADELKALSNQLFKAGIVDEPVQFAVKNFLHDKAIRDLHTLEMVAGSILEGATGRLEKLLKIFAPLPAMVGPLLDRLTDYFYSKAAARGVVVGWGCISKLPVQFADSVSLELVEGILSNLIENGIKYSNPNNPRRRIFLRFDGDTNNLEYTDNGIGMRPEFAAKLGSKAGLRERDRVGDVQGTGIGWPIIFKNLQRLGWSYEIETAPGQGLKVRIHIPPEHLVAVV